MNIQKNFAIIGLLIVLLTANGFKQLTTNKLLSHLESLNKAFKEQGGDLQGSFETTIIPMAKNPNNFENYIRIAAGVAAVVVPQPVGAIIGMTSATFFAFYDCHQAKKEKEIMKLATEKKLKEEKVFKENLLADIRQIGTGIAVQSQRVIDTVTKEINKLNENVITLTRRVIQELTDLFYGRTLLYDLRKTLNYLNTYYEMRINCLLKDHCSSSSSRHNIMTKLMNEESEFRKMLATFVRDFIDTTGTLHVSIGQEYGLYYYLLKGYNKRATDGHDCNVETEQSEIYRLYTSIMLTLQKSYSMITAAHMIQYRENLSNRTAAMSHFLAALEILKTSNADAITIAKITQAVIRQVSTEIRQCDPSKYIRGGNYDTFVQLYGTYTGFKFFHIVYPNGSHGYIEASFDPRLTPLSSYPISRDGQYGSVYDNKMIRLGNKCRIDHSIADITHYYDKTDTERFYHHIGVVYRNGTVATYGRSNIDERQSLIAKQYINPHRVRGHMICKRCPSLVETCQTAFNNSVRHVSSVPVNASPRHVVTGIRWRIRNKILYMEIQEGRYANGSVNVSTVHWKHTPEHKIGNKTIAIEEGSAKGFIMDDVKLPTGFFLSGVQFIWDGCGPQARDVIRLQIKGKRWIGDNANTISRTTFGKKNMLRLAIDNADASEYAVANSVLSKPGEHFVHFQMSDMKKDASQSSIPYLDIQDVYTTPSRPLQGVGLYYKGQSGFGGFIGLRVFIADLTPQVDPKMLEYYGTTINVIIEQLKDLTEGQEKNLVKQSTETVIMV